jgi:hypothetical protein
MRSQAALPSLFAWALIGLGVAGPVAAQQARIPGTSVTIAVPQGFRFSRRFPGLENPTTGSTVTIIEYPPEAYADLAPVFESPISVDKRFASEGVRITRLEQLTVDGAPVPLAIGGQEINRKEIAKYIALLGGAKTKSKTVVITFNVTDSDSLSASDVEAALKSTRLAPVETEEQKLARLPFTFKTVPPFHAATVSDTTVLLTSFEGADPSGGKPMIMIAKVPTGALPSETPKMAEKMLRDMAGFRDAEISEQGPVAFAGGQGQSISAVAGGRTMIQYLRVLPGGSLIRVVARADTAELEKVRDAVKAIAQSVQLPH